MIFILKINSRYYIISRVGRRISDKNPDKITVIVNTGFFRDFDQIYIRTNNYPINITEVIEYSVSKGYTAGGKDDVMGIIIPKIDTESFLNYIFSSWYVYDVDASYNVVRVNSSDDLSWIVYKGIARKLPISMGGWIA